jgi:methionine-rich copper-binding protein CopC
MRRLKERVNNFKAKRAERKTEGRRFSGKVTREVVIGAFVFLMLAVIGVSGMDGNITGFVSFEGIQEAVEGIEAPDLNLEDPESEPVQPETCGENCGLGNVPVREEGRLTTLDTSEDQASLFVSSNPAHGSTVGSLGEVTVTASTNMIAGSYIKLHQGNENRMVDRGYTTVDGNSMATASIVNTAGNYKAEYKIVTDNGQEEEGQFSFIVG